MGRRAAVPVSGLAQDGGRPLRRRLAHVRAARRHVRAAQGLPGLVLAGPVVFRLHLSQRSRLRVSTVNGPSVRSRTVAATEPVVLGNLLEEGKSDTRR